MHAADTAKTLWCPMVRAPAFTQARGTLGAYVASNKGTDGSRLNTGNCIAEKCSMWRWHEPRPRDERATDPGAPLSKRKGFCGLAGRPEIMP